MAEEKKEETKPEEEKKEEAKPEAEEKKEEVKEEPKAEEKKEEVKPEPKPEEKKEEKPAPAPAPEPKAEKKEEEKPVEVPKKFKKLVEEIEQMSVIDLAELVKILEKKFGVSTAVPMMAAAAAPGAAPAGAPTEEKAVFTVELKDTGGKKIEVIKVVRDVTQKGLKDSKDLVDAVASGPQLIKENVKKEEAEDIKKKFEAAGATVELK